MSFASWQYTFLLTAVFLLYWRLPWRGRLGLVLAASYLFYGFWDVRFLALLLTSTTIDYYCGLAISGRLASAGKVFATACLPGLWLEGVAAWPRGHPVVDGWILGLAGAFPVIFTALYTGLANRAGKRQAKAFLLLSIFSNLAVLGFFKYFNFFADTALTLAAQFGWRPGWTLPHIILPVAISFYTFQSIAYSVDIWRGRTRPEGNFLTFAAYLSFFPQLVAGPIERPAHLLPQFQKPAAWNLENLHHGLRLILVGLFKKLFVADNCALLANYAFDGKTHLNAPWAVFGVVAFAFQIYGDFSGYTDIARGSARLLGIELSRNFRFPYLARGPSDFWQRWHITLSSWFRDYVYIPLGGNRGTPRQTLRNLWITMVLAGLWHGANWTFLLWGAYHGTLLVCYRVVPGLQRLESSPGLWPRRVSIAVMFFFTLVGWAVFRANTFPQLADWFLALGRGTMTGTVPLGKPLAWLALHVTPLLLLQWATRHAGDEAETSPLPWPVRGLAYALMFAAVASSTAGEQEFIYFQF